MTDQQQARQQWQNRVNNAQGHFFEGAIMAACRFYHDHERAEIDKTPEPFRVTKRARTAFSQAALQPLPPLTFRGRLRVAALSSLKPSIPQRTP